MASFVASSPAVTTRLKWECLKGAALSELPVCQLPVKTTVSKNSSLSGSRKVLSGISQTSRLPLQTTRAFSHRQFILQDAVGDDDPVSTSEGTLTPAEQAEQEHDRKEANEPLAGEENSLPRGPAGARQYEERDPKTQHSEGVEGIIVENAHLDPLPASSVEDFDRNQERGWSESARDEGATLFSKSSTFGSSEALIERLLASLPMYDQGRSAEHYRIRAVVYGKIGEYFRKDEVRKYNPIDNRQNSMGVKMVTAMQQLADLILAEDGRSAADYNCRAEFFQRSAEIFCFSGDGKGPGNAAPVSESGEQKVGRALEQLEDVMLSGSGRSISDYNRRANVFRKTADALSAKRITGGVAAASRE